MGKLSSIRLSHRYQALHLTGSQMKTPVIAISVRMFSAKNFGTEGLSAA
jgi:hypothetical protein